MIEHGTASEEDVAALADGVAATAALAPMAQVATAAVVRLTLHVHAVGRSATARGWLTGHEAVLAIPQADADPASAYRVVTGHATHVVAALAHLLEIGPRLRVVLDEAVVLPVEEVAALTAAGAEPPEWLGGAVRCRWSLLAEWSTASGADGRGCEVLDTEAGYLELSSRDGMVHLTPSTPTDVFCLLRRVLPASEDLES